MKQKEITNLIFKFQKSAKNAPRPCLHDGCNQLSIDSHLLQKKGIIDSISENQHVVEISLNGFKKDFFEFKRVGIKEALSYPGFCNTHDTELFREIETDHVNFSDYKTQLLLSYRALMIERRKKEINIDWKNKIINSNTLSPFLDDAFKRELHESGIANKLGIQDQEHYKKLFLENLTNDKLQLFQFIYFELPRIEICSSAIFSYETTQEIAIKNILNRDKEKEPLTDVYFHLIPLSDKSIVIMGCNKQKVNICWDFISSFNLGNPNQSMKRISDLLICQVENWVCSPSFYLNYCKKRETKINNLVRISMRHPDERRELDFNIFD